MFSHKSLHNSGKPFFYISITLALKCGLLTPLYCSSFADAPWYVDQCIAHSL